MEEQMLEDGTIPKESVFQVLSILREDGVLGTEQHIQMLKL
jgi:hypothetical protein